MPLSSLRLRGLLFLGLIVGLPPFASADTTRMTLLLRADGSCWLTNEATVLRAPLEQQLRTWQRFKQRAEAANDGTDEDPPPPAIPPKDDSASYPDDVLEKHLRE